MRMSHFLMQLSSDCHCVCCMLLQCPDLVDLHPVHRGGDAVCGAILNRLCSIPRTSVSGSAGGGVVVNRGATAMCCSCFMITVKTLCFEDYKALAAFPGLQ